MGIIIRIKNWYQKRQNIKKFKKIQERLRTDPKFFNETRRKFIHAFGANTVNRTPLQWTRLVNVYGIDVVCLQEQMTKEEVLQRCKETKTERIKRMNREQNKLSLKLN
jgi:hypothetical protein